jgi:hypothetical protein
VSLTTRQPFIQELANLINIVNRYDPYWLTEGSEKHKGWTPSQGGVQHLQLLLVIWESSVDEICDCSIRAVGCIVVARLSLSEGFVYCWVSVYGPLRV